MDEVHRGGQKSSDRTQVAGACGLFGPGLGHIWVDFGINFGAYALTRRSSRQGKAAMTKQKRQEDASSLCSCGVSLLSSSSVSSILSMEFSVPLFLLSVSLLLILNVKDTYKRFAFTKAAAGADVQLLESRREKIPSHKKKKQQQQ